MPKINKAIIEKAKKISNKGSSIKKVVESNKDSVFIPKKYRVGNLDIDNLYPMDRENLIKPSFFNSETEAKPNEEQYRNRSETEAEPNAKQLPKQKRSNTETKTEQYRNRNETIPKQPSFITDTPSITLLSGKPKKIVFYLFESCSLNGGLETSEIMYSNMAIELKLKSRDVARVLTNRLVKQKYFHKIEIGKFS